MTRLLKEPLLHFLVLGAALFGLFSVVGKKETEPAKIVVSVARIENLASGFTHTRQRPPSAEELRGLIDDYIRDEVFYREGKAAGLDRDDTIVRRRLRQKMEFMAEDTGAVEPTDEQLTAYLTANAERFSIEDRLTFRHVYLSASRRDALEGDAKSVAIKLSDIGVDTDTTTLGDPFLLGDEFRGVTPSDIARSFGEPFAEQIVNLDTGRWLGPVVSGYGMHFVRISERAQGNVPQLDSIRAAVRREWMSARRQEAEANLYRTLRDRYRVVVEVPSPAQVPRQAVSEAVR